VADQSDGGLGGNFNASARYADRMDSFRFARNPEANHPLLAIGIVFTLFGSFLAGRRGVLGRVGPRSYQTRVHRTVEAATSFRSSG
jgi:hypothetical protein